MEFVIKYQYNLQKHTERRNTIVVTYQDGDGSWHSYQREANISDVKPTIDLLRKLDGVTTAESVIMITGTTNAEKLTLNGQDVEIKDGAFAYPYSLSPGENHIELEAVLEEGVTRLSALVTKEAGMGTLWMYPVAGLAISLAGIVILARSERKKRRKAAETAEGTADAHAKRKGFRGGIRGNWIAVIFCVVAWVALLVFTNTSAYLQVAYRSLLLAKGLLILKQVVLLLALVLTVIALIRMLLQAVKRKLAERKQRKEEGKNAKVE